MEQKWFYITVTDNTLTRKALFLIDLRLKWIGWTNNESRILRFLNVCFCIKGKDFASTHFFKCKIFLTLWTTFFINVYFILPELWSGILITSNFRFTSSNLQSKMKYAVRSEMDYGTLRCFAQNNIGLQHKPCSFEVLPPGENFV